MLDPFSILQNKYTSENDKLEKINRKNNQAYIDCITTSVLSNLRSTNITKHALESYGYICGIKNVYKYNITDDYSSLRNKKWFWDKVGLSGEKLIIETDLSDNAILEQLKNPPEYIFDSGDDKSINSFDYLSESD